MAREMGPGLVRRCWYQGGRLPEIDVCRDAALGASIKAKQYPLPDPRDCGHEGRRKSGSEIEGKAVKYRKEKSLVKFRIYVPNSPRAPSLGLSEWQA